jgi:hypothetical protein
VTTAVETASTRTCRCGETITNEGTPPHPVHRSQWSWAATEGGHPGKFWCADGQLHAPACPPSSVVDQIIPWADVRTGDLVLWDGEFRYAEMTGYLGHQRAVLLDGESGVGTIPCGTYAAVRRYVEG